MAIPGKNSDLIKRFKFYGFGLALGILTVSIVKKGDSCQMPASAKLDELSSQTLVYCNDSSCAIKEAEIVELLGVWKTGTTQIVGSGKVNFDLSDPRAEHNSKPTYVIEGTTKAGKKIRVFIADADTISKVVKAIDLKIPNDSCVCK